MQANITFINEKQLNLKAANQSQKPEIIVVPAPILQTAKTLTDDIIDSLWHEMRARNIVLAETNLPVAHIISSNVRAFGRLFLATLATLPEREREKILEEFDTLTIQFLN